MAFRNCLHQLLLIDPKAWVDVQNAAPRTVRADNLAIDDYWRGQPRTASKVLTMLASTSNDLYLKSSGHVDGVLSYGRMVDLLIAHLDR